jgi:hypothetical protein
LVAMSFASISMLTSATVAIPFRPVVLDSVNVRL